MGSMNNDGIIRTVERVRIVMRGLVYHRYSGMSSRNVDGFVMALLDGQVK